MSDREIILTGMIVSRANRDDLYYNKIVLNIPILQREMMITVYNKNYTKKNMCS